MIYRKTFLALALFSVISAQAMEGDGKEKDSSGSSSESSWAGQVVSGIGSTLSRGWRACTTRLYSNNMFGIGLGLGAEQAEYEKKRTRRVMRTANTLLGEYGNPSQEGNSSEEADLMITDDIHKMTAKRLGSLYSTTIDIIQLPDNEPATLEAIASLRDAVHKNYMPPFIDEALTKKENSIKVNFGIQQKKNSSSSSSE